MFSLKIKNGKPVYQFHAATLRSLERCRELLKLGGSAMHPQAEAGVKILQDLLDGQRTDNASQKQHSQAQESPQDDQELAELLS